jgi:hypothetical protein
MKNYLIVYCCLFLWAACQSTPSEQAQREALETQVLRVHDEAMAKMDHLFILRQNLKKLSDSLQTRQTDTVTRKLVEQHIALLQKADEAMLTWMHRYRAPEKGQAQDSTRQYLQRELQKIKQVKKTMDSTLAAAQQIYKHHEPKK